MSNFMIFIFKSALSLAVFGLVYRLFFMQDINFRMRRAYLLSSLILSIILPVLNLNFESASVNLPSIVFSELGIYEKGITTIRENSAIPLLKILLWVYAAIAALIFFRVVYQSSLVFRNSSRLKGERTEGLRLFILPGSGNSFSFFRSIFIGEKCNEEDRKKILEHEKIHARELHTLDVLFAEILTGIFWFNPLIWWYRKELRNVHEYLADEGALSKGISLKEYQITLLEHLIGSASLSITNNFNYSLIKNRIAMMNKIKNGRKNNRKYFLLLPVVVLLLITFACTEKSDKDAQEEIIAISPEDEEVFFVVEEMPQFNGGDAATEFRKYIAEHLKYPEEAAKNDISGRVIIQFSVNSEGEVGDVRVIRGIHPSIDQEAVRVVSSSPRWTPGRQDGERVKVMFTFPMNFMLSNDK